MKPLQKSTFIEVILNNASATKFPFPQQNYLIGKRIVAIIGSVQPFGVTSGKVNVVAAAVASPAAVPTFLTFQDKQGNQFIQNLPLVEICPVKSEAINYLNNANGVFEILPREILWTKSFLYFPATLTVDTYCAQFQIFYID